MFPSRQPMCLKFFQKMLFGETAVSVCSCAWGSRGGNKKPELALHEPGGSNEKSKESAVRKNPTEYSVGKSFIMPGFVV